MKRTLAIRRTGAGVAGDWRWALRRSIGGLLLIKLIALILIKNLFFSSEHRLQVTPGLVDARLSLHTAAVSSTVSGEMNHD